MNLDNNIVDRWLARRPLNQLHPGCPFRLVRYDDCLHRSPLGRA
jgi:hypothetical protein